MSLSSVWFGWQPEMERNSAMMPTTKRLLSSCGLHLAIQIPGTIVSVTHGLPGALAGSGLACREAHS